jgi:hypothetical protein
MSDAKIHKAIVLHKRGVRTKVRCCSGAAAGAGDAYIWRHVNCELCNQYSSHKLSVIVSRLAKHS